MNETSNSSAYQEDEIDLREIFSILFRHKWLILGCTLFSFFIAYIYVQGQKPVYEANALIQIEQKRARGLPVFGELSGALGSDSEVSTEIEILKSRFILGKVVDNQLLQVHVTPEYLPLAEYAPSWSDALIDQSMQPNEDFFGAFGLELDSYSKQGASITLGAIVLPIISSAINLTLKVTSPTTYDMFDETGHRLYSASVGVEPPIGQPVNITIQQINAHVGAEFTLSFTHRIHEINRLRSRLQIQEQGKNTGILSIVLEGENTQKTQNILNDIIQVYADQNVARLSEEAERSIQFLDKQIPLVQTELNAAEQAVNQYRLASSHIDLEMETETKLKRIVEIESRLNELQLKENEIRERYKTNHPVYANLLKRKDSLLKEKQQVDRQIEKLPVEQQELLSLMRNVEVANTVYLQLLNKMEELKITRAGTVGNVRILDDAQVIPNPVKPKKTRILMIATLLGAFFGIGMTILRTWLNAGLQNPVEIQEKLGLANYGVIPLSAQQGQIDKNALNSKDDALAVLAVVGPTDPALEAIRSIRTSLHFAMLEAGSNLVMLTSPSPDGGKSFVSTNLAILIAQSGQQVLLVDMDLRRGAINKALRKPRYPGLSDFLGNGAAGDESLALSDIIHEKILPNLDFIATGTVPPNPSELIMSAGFTQFLDRIQPAYDIVIIDTPPVLAVTDASLIGHQVGTSLLVVRHKMNNLPQVQQAKNELERLEVPLKGYIYNFIESTAKDRYYYNYYHYGYGGTRRRNAPWHRLGKKFRHFFRR